MRLGRRFLALQKVWASALLGLPNAHALFRRQVHSVAGLDAVELMELFKLLQGHVDAQVVKGVRVFVKADVGEFLLAEAGPEAGVAFKEKVVVKAALLF